MPNGTSISPGNNTLVLNPYMAQLQAQFGSFDPNKVQTRRRSYYSFVAYPTAGQTSFTFFSTTVGQSNRQLTNIQRSGHLDNPLIVRALRTRYFMTTHSTSSFDGTDASTIYSDIVNGFFYAGVMRVVIGSKEWIQLPCPFLYAPPAYGAPRVYTAGNSGSNKSSAPHAYLQHGKPAAYVMDPPFMIGSDQNFQVTIEFPNGAIAPIATGVVTSSTVLYIGVDLDGIEVRPVQ